MAGTIPYSLSQQFDALGNVLAGGRLYLIQAGTVSTPQNAYQDSALTLVLPNPIILNAAGRLPQFFLADGSIKIRLTDANGVEQVTADGILVVGASSGGGGGSPVDPTTVIATGDLKFRYGAGNLTGFVRANGRAIGSATSGAFERANADCQALFEYLWNADPNLGIGGGRGVSSLADWTANKTLVLPDWRGRVIAGLDDMGNSAAGRLTASYFGATATVLGAPGGSESTTLTAAQLPTNIPYNDPTHTHALDNNSIKLPGGVSFIGAGGTGVSQGGTSQAAGVGITINPTGGNNPHRTVQPTMLTTFYIKL